MQRRLEMKQQSVRSTDAKGLHRVRARAGERHRTGHVVEEFAMPLQYRETRRQRGADHVRAALRSELDLVEADLERRSPLDHPTRCLGDQLRAETNAEYGSLRANPSAQQRDLGTDPRKVIVDAH